MAQPLDDQIAEASALLHAGRLVAFPTETVYGLGANALDTEAVARIYAVKRRPPTSPLIVHVASVAMAQSLVAHWPPAAERLTSQFWPGPLTLVLPLAPDSSRPISALVTANLPTVGLRMPAHPVAMALLRAANLPVAAPSANRFTELSPTTAGHVRTSLGDEVDYILDGGPCRVGIESTVLSLAQLPALAVLLRPGGISRTAIEALIGPVLSAADPIAGAHPSPGMHPRHYSPRTPLFLIQDGNWTELEHQGKSSQPGKGLYLQHSIPPNRDVTIHQMPRSAAEYAAALYGTLHHADMQSYKWIAVDVPPATPEWEAVLDRLTRAAMKRAER